MQSAASTSGLGPARLTDPNLRSHTAREGVAPRRTVEIYLEGIRRAQGYFEIPSVPINDSGSPPPAPPSRRPAVAAGPSQPSRYPHLVHDLDDDERDIGETRSDRDTALVIHRAAPPRAATPKATAAAERQKGLNVLSLDKKPSVVSAMRPRLATVRNDDRTGTPTKASKRKVGSEPPRAPEIEGEKENHREGRRGDRDKVKRRKGKGKAIELDEVVTRRSERGKGTLRSEPETEKEALELEERLEARKERRREKAFIRKDHTQSAKTMGKAAASKLSIAKKRGHEREDSDSDDAEASGGQGVRTRKGRKTAEQSGRELIQGLERPGAIRNGRLTLKSSMQLGLFNKGKASARIKVGQAVPDLAFSEMRFPNATRPIPAPEAHPSSQDDPQNLVLVRKDGARSSDGRRTYGSKRSLRRHSSAHRKVDFSSSSSSSTGSEEPLSEQENRAHRRKTERIPAARPSSGQARTAATALGETGSRPTRRTNRIDPEIDDKQPRPHQEAPEFVARDESTFSAHSAHSLAVRRRIRMERATGEDIRGSVEAGRQDASIERVREQEAARLVSIEPGVSAVAPAALLPFHRSPSIPHFETIPAVTVNDDPAESPLRGSPSIRTESMQQILRDNASTEPVQTPDASVVSTQLRSSIHGDLVREPSPSFGLLATFRRRLRSCSAVPSSRSPPSLLPHKHSLDRATVAYDKGSDVNPFADSNYGRNDSDFRAFAETQGGKGRGQNNEEEEDDDDDTPGWQDAHASTSAYGFDSRDDEPTDESFSKPGCRLYFETCTGALDLKETQSFEPRVYRAGLSEVDMSGFWERNIL